MVKNSRKKQKTVKMGSKMFFNIDDFTPTDGNITADFDEKFREAFCKHINFIGSTNKNTHLVRATLSLVINTSDEDANISELLHSYLISAYSELFLHKKDKLSEEMLKPYKNLENLFKESGSKIIKTEDFDSLLKKKSD